ncbi:MAG: hypothetical protein ABFS38_13440 [Bacteroidota bacterium]
MERRNFLKTAGVMKVQYLNLKTIYPGCHHYVLLYDLKLFNASLMSCHKPSAK